MMYNSFLKKTVALCMGLTLMLGVTVGTMPRTTHAQLVVLDPTNLIQTTASALAVVGINSKEFLLDPIAWAVSRIAIQTLVRSTVNWINSGFEGSPAFVTDLQRNLLRLGDIVASKFVDELAGQIITTPYAEEISAAVRVGYYLSTGNTPFYVRYPYTLSTYSDDPAAFLGGDFSQGGYNALFSTIVNPQNNPYGAYQLALNELNERLTTAQNTRKDELNWGDGFLSFRDCQGGDNIEVQLAGGNDCFATSIKTPGSVIAPRINEALGLGEKSLVTADEIDEIVGALFQQLVGRVLGSGGLLGVTQQSDGGGRSFLEQATDPGQYQAPSASTTPSIPTTPAPTTGI
ncbi:MAG TPA: hypothetical protein VHO23_03585 [Candidatus Paceibacterota bacterium]|nr:hypothetical protein [Candidatus Paceibacterota bacterium]